MTSVIFELRDIPDLSLNKYSNLEESGVDGVIAHHNSFLRQLHRLGRTLDGTFSLYYQYAPSFRKGSRMRCCYKWIFNRDAEPDELMKIANASSIGQYFRFIQIDNVHPEDDTHAREFSLDSDFEYKFLASLKKKEKISISDGQGNGKQTYYSVNKWAMNPTGRLFNVFSLMRELNKPCLYNVIMHPVDLTDKIESPELLGKTLAWLRHVLTVRVEKGSGGVAMQRDEAADYTLKRYKELIEEVSANPHFYVNVNVYAEDPVTAASLLDAAASEALSQGMHEINFSKGSYKKDYVFSRGFTPEANNSAPKELRFWPNLMLLDEVIPFAVLPTLYDGETIEMRKETAPPEIKGGLLLGVDADGLSINFPLKNFPKHAFISGVPGSGKTNTMMHIASTLHIMYKIPCLILEPAKKEYRALFNQPGMEDTILFSPSAGTRFPLHINPFEFPHGISLSEHIRLLDEVFEGAFNLDPPFPFLLDSCIEDIYRDKGWHPKMKNAGDLLFPTISELYKQLEKRLDSMGYEKEIRDNLKTVLQVRINSLLSREIGDVFNVASSSLSPEEWLKTSVIIETESMGNGPANFLSLLLSSLIRETLKANPMKATDDKSKPRHVIFFEEAHNLIGPVAEEGANNTGNTKTAATAFIVKMLAEVRALNEAIVIADQLPSALASEVIKNTSLKISHRLVDQEERNVICGAMSANGVQFERMATFTTGKALISYEGLLRPFETRIAQWAKGQVPTISPQDEEVLRRVRVKNSPLLKMMKRSGEINMNKYAAVCDIIVERLSKAKALKIAISAKKKDITESIEKAQNAKHNADEEIKELRMLVSGPITYHDRTNLLIQIEKDIDTARKAEDMSFRGYEALKEMDKSLQKLRETTLDIYKNAQDGLVDIKYYAIQNPIYQEKLKQLHDEKKDKIDKLMQEIADAGQVLSKLQILGGGQ
jgi:hypothetical protein